MALLNQTIQWHITEVCKNRCKHCYIGPADNARRKNEELSFENLISILNNLEGIKKTGIEITNFAITGGDPFDHPSFEELLNELCIRNKNVKILGIPERITESNLAMLERFHITEYQVSLDGLAETHDAIRGKGSFDRTIEAITLLCQKSKIRSHIMFTLHSGNYTDLFPLITYLDNLNLAISFSFDLLIFEGMAAKGFQLLDSDIVEKILNRYHMESIRLKKENHKLRLREKIKFYETFGAARVNERFKNYSFVSGCSCGISGAAIEPNGDLYPCRRLPIKIGNLLDENYIELFINHPLMRKLRRVSSYTYCHNCDFGKICRGCPALSYSLVGSPFAQTPYCIYKKETIPFLQEPPLSCSAPEELEYLENNFLNQLAQNGIGENLSAISYYIHKELLKKDNS